MPGFSHVWAEWMDYQTYIESPEWRERAKDATARAAYKCQVCSSMHKLNVHHNTYDRLGKELPTDLCVLCTRCHELFHQIRNGKPTRMPDDNRCEPKRLSRNELNQQRRKKIRRDKYNQRLRNIAQPEWRMAEGRRLARVADKHISEQMKVKGAVSPRTLKHRPHDQATRGTIQPAPVPSTRAGSMLATDCSGVSPPIPTLVSAGDG